MVWAVKHFRHYFYGQHCEVITDQEVALKSLLNTPHHSGMALQEVDLSIGYRPSRKNAPADALSRAPLRDGTLWCLKRLVWLLSQEDSHRLQQSGRWDFATGG